MKLTIETIKQLIKEELQHIIEAAAPVEHSYREEFTNVAGWEDNKKLYQLFQAPKTVPIVQVYANVFGKLYAYNDVHFMEHSRSNNKIFKTEDCDIKTPFDPEDSMLFEQLFLAYSTMAGVNASPSRYNFKTAGGFEVIFEGDEATELAKSLNIPIDDAPNIPELSDFYPLPKNENGEDAWSYSATQEHFVAIKSPLIPITTEKDGQKIEVLSCPTKYSRPKKLGIRLYKASIIMQKEPQLQEESGRVLMRATNNVESLKLQIDVMTMK